MYIDCLIFILFVTITLINIMKVCIFYGDSIFALNFGSADSILQMSSNNNGLPGNTGFPGNPGDPNNIGGNPQPGGGPTIIHQTPVIINHTDGT
jgi:hypothetical protein